ncbi:Asp-tRNA(Asn)/Glu-tRNA(Gln) amidotransferase subunit GatA [Candidatus Beckwithbacteria bacterium]|nr:Asp-tRNA(Asn)/Glu-tRNA(Gln) amidotransferase subunit GatA [Candidatus Beckwithbacteria bacterium]
MNYTVKSALVDLKTKKISSLELVQSCFEQIKKHDQKLSAFLTLNEAEALKQAKEIDQNPQGKPLEGVPFVLKDNFLTKGLKTTASSKVLENYIPTYESTVSQKLKDAGAILLGKTNMDAWAHGSSTETSDFGPTKNPWDIKRLPGGSSGGSAAAQAAAMTVFAIGSETAGSIRQPASWCGVTGLKPSYGRCSRYGVVAMASSTDSPGPITQTAEDAALVLSVIAGKDSHDATTIPENSWQIDSLDIDNKLKIGVIDEYFLDKAEKGVNETVLQAIDSLKKNNKLAFSKVSLLDPKYAIAIYTILQRSEVSSNLARYDGVRYGHDRSYFGDEAKRRIMLGTFALSVGYYDAYYKKAQKVRTKIMQDFEKVFEQVDLLVAPTSPSLALPLGATQGQAMFGEMQDVLVEASSIAGLPGISIPCGFVDGLPVGLQIIGKMGDEARVLKLPHYYQQITNWHQQTPIL